MRLSNIAILALRGCDIKVKESIAEALKVTLTTVHRYIQQNDDSLTKAAALEIIRGALGKEDAEILEKEPSEVKEPQS